MCKPIVWLASKIKTPPFSGVARIEAGTLLRRLQNGESIGMPNSRPMPSIGPRCHELRIQDNSKSWRVVYRTDTDAVVIGGVFPKKTKATPVKEISTCKSRFKKYDEDMR
jgi:phage-related protein